MATRRPASKPRVINAGFGARINLDNKPAAPSAPSAAAASANPANLQQWAISFIDQLPGAAKVSDPNDARVRFLIAWATTEGTYQNGTDPNNPLDITGNYGHPSGDISNNPNQNNGDPVRTYADFTSGAQALDKFLQQGYDAPILAALRNQGSTLPEMANALGASNWTGKGANANANYAQSVVSNLGASGSVVPQIVVPGSTAATGGGNVPTAGPPGSGAPRKPMAGVNLRNFHGYDLSQIPKEQLGDVEYGIQTYITNPNQQVAATTYDAAGNPTGNLSSSIASRLKSDYGYGSWAMNNKELAPILIAAVVNGWDENTFTGAVTATNWYKSTSESQRDWQITLSTDPGKANAELNQAKAKVLQTENTSGVQLTAAQFNQIAHTVAANSATLTGVLGSEAGMTQEQIEQLVVQASNLAQQTQQGAKTGTLGGIAGELLDNFRTQAQQYLMYDPASPDKSLLSDANLIQHVQDAMKKYTGVGSFGANNLIAGAEADFTQFMKQQASQFYPSLAGSIQTGTTPQAYVQPLQRFVANTLGFGDNSGAINVLDPQWNWMIATPDPKTGVKSALTQDQILQKITDPAFKFQAPDGHWMSYDNTNTAIQTAIGFQQAVNSAFGKAA